MNVGVIIGRFQVPNLHGAHRRLIDHVFERFDKVFIFLGSPMGEVPDRRNPLSVKSRYLMLSHYINNYCDRGKLIEIRKLLDINDDQRWSELIDRHLFYLEKLGNEVVLVGGRDSFIPHYLGKYSTQEFSAAGYEQASGTALRDNLEVFEGEPAFRAGYIKAIQDICGGS